MFTLSFVSATSALLDISVSGLPPCPVSTDTPNLVNFFNLSDTHIKHKILTK